MSKILRRPMFRGGPVDSRGTGITSGLDKPKRGLRIDHIWVTQKLNSIVKKVGIDYDIRGMEKPSDHAPIWTQFDL